MTKRPDVLVSKVSKYFDSEFEQPAMKVPENCSGPFAWYFKTIPRIEEDFGISITGSANGTYSVGFFIDSTVYHLPEPYTNDEVSAIKLIADMETRFALYRRCIASPSA